MPSGDQRLVAIRWSLLTKFGRQAVREQSGLVLADEERARGWVLGRGSGARFGPDELAFQSLHDFADGPLATYVLGATRADLPFAASRMARHWGAAATVLPAVRNPRTGEIVLRERMSPYAGGWSLSLWGAPRPGRPGSWDDGPGKRRLRIRHLDGESYLSGWSRPAKRTTVAGKTEQTPPAGRPFDMGHLARALNLKPPRR